MIIDVAQFKAQRSLRKIIKRGDFEFSYDQAFPQVIRACAAPRQNSPGTWLVDDMIDAYIHLHQHGHAHSFEAWRNNQLVGGFYGVAIGQVFFGESMFSLESNASKACLSQFIDYAKQWHYQLVDCQVYSDHLASLGAKYIKRAKFINLLEQYCQRPIHQLAWQDCQKLK
jgi:leucyl/phenylalanyl-tRNA--protein transferase